jgi:hypothetical protein
MRTIGEYTLNWKNIRNLCYMRLAAIAGKDYDGDE